MIASKYKYKNRFTYWENMNSVDNELQYQKESSVSVDIYSIHFYLSLFICFILLKRNRFCFHMV